MDVKCVMAEHFAAAAALYGSTRSHSHSHASSSSSCSAETPPAIETLKRAKIVFVCIEPFFTCHNGTLNNYNHRTMIFRKRRADEQFLRHSEWARRLGIPLVFSLAGIKSMSMMLFIILPISLTQLAGPSTVFALLFTFLIVFASTIHLSELTCAMPKNCVQYHFCYSVLGELPAFIVGWIALADYLSQASLFARAWAEHFNLLFRKLPGKALSIPVFDENSTVLSPHFDLLNVIAALITFSLLLCSLRVVGTICVSLLAVSLLIAASCSMVAFFHADPQNWLNADFFTFGFRGVLYSMCALCACYTGVESTSSLLEETKKPRSTIPSLLTFLVVILTVAFFIFALVLSLSVNTSALADDSMIPEIFTVLSIPSARYMLTVCSVCALSGGVLASFLPVTRIIAVLSHDQLIPFVKDTSTKSPYYAVILCTFAICVSTILQKSILLNFVIFITPIKLAITIFLTFLQHYLTDPIGIPEETSAYKAIGKKKNWIRIDDDSTDERETNQTSDHSSMVSHSTVDTTAQLYLKAARMESDRLQKRLEREERMREKEPVLPKSVSQYQAIGQSRRVPLTMHNCIGEECGKDRDETCNSGDLHLFSCEEPEVPFFSSSPCPSSHHSIKSTIIRNAIILFLIYSGLVAALAITGRLIGYDSHICQIFTAILLSAAFVVAVLICRLRTNDSQHKKSARVPMFPFLSLLPIFLLVIGFAGSIPITTFYAISIVLATGFVIYFSYGYHFSRQQNSRCVIIENRDNCDQYAPIIGNETSSEM
ncbi:unnamed protein product [Caenorhabditis bovis]|uniref:Amino acid permease/ SLC12A domain-containing protein n=1 Tax=Caenorhabditis bovis TaxID=2654633 RepID=A0A8S1FD94_9PELO|nr:unnamed protein product [Caenorhabditis bovis]